ncbi:MAG: hypothetical protein J6V82_02955 [Clostridia bacterium]|nr:hypothetical protein [Clostridia bacterium]
MSESSLGAAGNCLHTVAFIVEQNGIKPTHTCGQKTVYGFEHSASFL